MEKGSSTPLLSTEYARMTNKYREVLGLSTNQVLTKVWVFNNDHQILQFTKQERDRFRLLLDLQSDPNAINFTTGVVATGPIQIGELELEQLLTLYTLNEMSRGDFAGGLDYLALSQALDGIVTVSIKDQVQNIETLKEIHCVLATIATFKESSVLLNKIRAASENIS